MTPPQSLPEQKASEIMVPAPSVERLSRSVQPLTKAQRKFLEELTWGDLHRLSGPQTAMGHRMKARRLVSFKPETADNYETWRITAAGEAALTSARQARDGSGTQ